MAQTHPILPGAKISSAARRHRLGHGVRTFFLQSLQIPTLDATYLYGSSTNYDPVTDFCSGGLRPVWAANSITI